MDVRIGMGAEAIVTEGVYLGLGAIVKTRPVKGYRHPDLDAHLRTVRTRNEVRTMKCARDAGVRTPVIYDVDPQKGIITMERIHGRKVRDIMEDDMVPDTVCDMIGKAIADMHNHRICHGDLTTSNMMLTDDGELCILDFSMGAIRCGLEEMGVDIHLLERAFASAHSEHPERYERILASYKRNYEQSNKVLERVETIKRRARYT